MTSQKEKAILSKEERVSAEIKRLSAIFRGIEAKRKKSIQSLIENAAFMAVTLEDLQADMNANGIIEKYQNGANQWGTKKSPKPRYTSP